MATDTPRSGCGHAGQYLQVRDVDTTALPSIAEREHLYAIISAVNRPDVIAEVERLGPERAVCLERGHFAVGTLAYQAAFLVKLGPEQLTWLQTFHAQPWGFYLVSRTSLPKLRRHWRKYLYVTARNATLWRFRYYDPRLLPRFLAACDGPELKAFFGPCTELWVFPPDAERGAAYTMDPVLESIEPQRLPIGQNFPLHNRHLRALREGRLATALIATFDDAPYQAERDPESGDLLIKTSESSDPLRIAFDNAGHPACITSPLGRQWQIDQESTTGRCIGFNTPSGSRLKIQPSPDSTVTTITRNDAHICTEHHDALGRFTGISYPDQTRSTIRYRYPDRDRLGRRIAATTNRLGYSEHWHYDASGDVSAVTDAKGHTTAYAYGRYNRPETITYPDGRAERVHYNARRQIDTLQRGTHGVALTYTIQGHLETLSGSDGVKVRYAYNDAGQITSAHTPDCPSFFVYDNQGLLVEERSQGQQLRYHYDSLGQPSGLTYPGRCGEVHYARDADGRITQITAWDGHVYRIDYANDDRSWRLTTQEGLILTQSTDPQGLPLRQTVQDRNQSLQSDRHYAYDNEDRLQQLHDSQLGEQRYTYDVEGQILTLDGPEQETFRYDPAGNRIEASGETTTYTSTNQIVAPDVAYDAAGNLIARGPWRYTYNSRQQLIAAEKPGCKAQYRYDAFGRRISKIVDRPDPRGGTQRLETKTVWMGEQRLQETVTECWHQGDGEIITAGPRICQTDAWLYWPGTHTPMLLQRRRPGQVTEVYLYETDHLGSPIRLRNRRGRIVWSARYKAFGQAVVTIDTVPQPLRLPGQYYDEETGLHENRFRYYDPETGRYLSPDPLGYLNGLNLYRYAGNNPINRADPLGLFSLGGFLKAAAPIVAGVVVAAAVVALAPVALPLAIVAGGAIGGAVMGGLSEYLNSEELCLQCIGYAALKGAVIGAVAAAPFAFLPASAGAAAFAGAGAASGGIGYLGDCAANGTGFSWKGFGTAVGIGLVTAGAGRFIGNKVARWKNKPPPSYARETNRSALGARGQYSGRDFDPDKAGGPVRRLKADRIRITNKGVDTVEKHLSRFESDEANTYMTTRLRRIANGEISPTTVDKNFYSHELREYVRYRKLGWENGQPSNPDEAYNLWNNAHTATLEDYGISGNPNTQLYHPEAIALWE